MRDFGTLAGWIFLLLAIVCVVLYLIVGGVGSIFESRAEALRAEAAIRQAEVDMENAKKEREHQQSVDWQREFQLYIVSLVALSNDNTTSLCVLSAVSALLVGAVIVLLGERYWRKREAEVLESFDT